MHEPEFEAWHWKGDADILEFLNIAQQEDLLVLLRPGPYICAERDFVSSRVVKNSKTLVFESLCFSYFQGRLTVLVAQICTRHTITHQRSTYVEIFDKNDKAFHQNLRNIRNDQ